MNLSQLYLSQLCLALRSDIPSAEPARRAPPFTFLSSVMCASRVRASRGRSPGLRQIALSALLACGLPAVLAQQAADLPVSISARAGGPVWPRARAGRRPGAVRLAERRPAASGWIR